MSSLSWHVRKSSEVLWSIRGYYQTIWRLLSRMIIEIMEHDHILWNPPMIRYYTKLWPCCYRVWLLTKFRVFIAHLQRTCDATPLDAWSCPILGFAYDLMCFKNLSCFRTLSFDHRLVLLFYFPMFVLLITQLLQSTKVGLANKVKHTNCVPVVTPTGRPTSVRSHCVILHFDDILYLCYFVGLGMLCWCTIFVS